MAGAGLAQEKALLRRTITLPEDVMVGETLVKQGTYEVRFDAKSNEVTLLKGKEVVAKAKATVEAGQEKARLDSLAYSGTEKGKKLNRLTFAGDRRTVVIDAGASTAAKQ